MRNHGFVRIAAASPEIRVADCAYNLASVLALFDQARAADVGIVVFPEMCLTGYTLGDLVRQQTLLDGAMRALLDLTRRTAGSRTVAICGLPLAVHGRIYNAAAVVQDGHVLGIVPKTFIPSNNEFYEHRWFASATELRVPNFRVGSMNVPIGADLLFSCDSEPGLSFGVEICEDLWVPNPPGARLAVQGAVLLFNPSASNELIGKSGYRRSLVENQSARCLAAYAYASANPSESTTDLVFGGHCMVAEAGRVLAESDRFQTASSLTIADVDFQRLLHDRANMATFHHDADYAPCRNVEFALPQGKLTSLRRPVERNPFVPSDLAVREERCREILAIQTSGLAGRMRHTRIGKLVIGVSGGLDSTLALIVAARTLDRLGLPRKNLIAVTMPGFGTTDRTYANAVSLMKDLGCDIREIHIAEACLLHFRDIGHDPSVHDVTYENVQARERTQLLMDMGNREGALVVGTGDLSELALGWCTYNGDHMSMYAVNCGVPKTLVRYVIGWHADHEAESETAAVLRDILDTPISPELLPPDPDGKIRQKTEDVVGPYELHDFFLYHFVRYGARPAKLMFLAQEAFQDSYAEETIHKWLRMFLRRFFQQQFKRSCLPDGPKVGTITLSPRGDWRMPSDASAEMWLAELDQLK